MGNLYLTISWCLHQCYVTRDDDCRMERDLLLVKVCIYLPFKFWHHIYQTFQYKEVRWKSNFAVAVYNQYSFIQWLIFTSTERLHVLALGIIGNNAYATAYMSLTLSNVEFYLDESIVELCVNWNHFDSNGVGDNVVQWKFIPPLKVVVIWIDAITFRQAELWNWTFSSYGE